MSEINVAFPDIPRPNRQSKPRTRGLSMMIDWGMGLAAQADVLEISGQYIDKAKIAASIPTILPIEILKRKIKLYQDNAIDCSPGGLFAELALKQGTYDKYLQEARAVGFDAVEISDNLLKITPQEKGAAIRRAIKKYGLKVYGEVGRKEGRLTDEVILRDIGVCLDAGCDQVYLEAAELFNGDKARDDLIKMISDRFPMNKLIFELPVVVIPGSSHWAKLKVAAKLVATLGTEVGFANVEADEFPLFEMTRLGMGGDTSHPEGAYRQAGFS